MREIWEEGQQRKARKVADVYIHRSNEGLKLGLRAERIAKNKEVGVLVKLHVGVEYDDAPRVEVAASEGEIEECGSVSGREVDHSLDNLQREREPRQLR